jgi:hypothetical protein
MVKTNEGEPQTQDVKVVIFGGGFLEPTLRGDKEITIRRYRLGVHDIKAGQYLIGHFIEGYDLLLQATADTVVKTFGDLTDEEAQADGFVDAKDALSGMRRFYPDLKKEDQLAIIRFEIPKIEGIPVIQPSS